MEKYTYDTDNNEKLTEVRVRKVWLNEDLMPVDSAYREMYPEVWRCIQEEVDAEWKGIHFELKDLKKLILSSPELFIVFLTTESKSSNLGWRISQRAYLTNRTSFIMITCLMGFTNHTGCRCQAIHPPYEDFINELIGEVYF